ncbi:hypothetical protein AB1Y20_011266 [Prymnesium parvum]|uniref:Uncharacterized protein n=1 Tax=Prymnesium parvum TaxID=97485 RepID=A0AB34IMX0_PRYPA
MPSAKKASPSARDASPRATPSPRGPASPRGHGSPQKASPPPSRASNRRTAFDEGHRTASLAAAQREARQRAKVYQTETEQAFTEPSTRQVRQPRPPPRPKAADTNFLSENLLVPDPTKMPWERASMMDLYPEKYKGSAGITSTEKEKQLARSTMVEYFPEKHAQSRIASEFEEVVYGRGADGVQEVALLNPNAFMGGAGLTSKEYALRVRRSQIEERLQNPEKVVEPAPYLATAADELVYGRGLVRDKRGSRKSIIDLPTKGSGHATYDSAAGLSSIDVQQMTAEPLELALDKKIDERSRPHLGSTVDKLIYNSSKASGANSPTDIKSLKPKLFENAAGITSQESASPDLKAFRTNKKSGHRLHQARSGGEGEELMYGRTSALEFEVQKLAPKSYEGAAGMKSKDVFLRNKTEQMYLRHIPVSASSLTNEAKYTIYFDKLPEDKPMFDISHLYPKEYRHAAGGSSRALFENGPEAERRHMFSENLKKHTVGKKGHGYDARASSRVKEGAAGLRSEQLFDGHELHGIGDERPSISVEASKKKIPHNMRGEAASVLLYGSEDPNAEENFELIPCIPDRNPKAFEDAAGLESGVIMRVHDTLCARHDPGAHKLSLARWGGESEELIYGKGPTNVSVEYEVQKLAPKAYEGAYGTSSKKISTTMLRNVDPEMNDSPSFDIPELLPEKFIGAAGMTSKDWCRQRNGHWMFGEKVEGAAHGIVLQQTGNTTMREVSEISKQPHPHQRPPLTVLEGVKRRNTENGQIECTNSISMRNIDGKQKNSGMRSIIFPDMTKQMKHTECQ